MIGEISHQADITLFLDTEDLEKLSVESIEGVLIKTQNRKRQGKISLCVEGNSSRILLDDRNYWGRENFEIKATLSAMLYQELQNNGLISMRQDMIDGSKIHIYDLSRADSSNRLIFENLEFYRDNKYKLA